jgi:GntR family transcriptional regulator, transcriptional repressor for pyruvate dehydrogenase complex
MKRAYDQMIATIEEEVFSGQLKCGDKLPTERQLRDQYQLSRGSVREALRVLEQRGLIQIRKGSWGGAFISELSAHTVSRTLADFMRQANISYTQMIEFRESIETRAAGFAAERATPQEIAGLKEMLANLVDHARQDRLDFRKYYQLEARLHQELARISKNPLFEWIAGTVTLQNWDIVGPPLTNEADEVSRSLEDWVEIVAAIENRESMNAQTIIRTHLGRYGNYLRSAQRRNPDGDHTA